MSETVALPDPESPAGTGNRLVCLVLGGARSGKSRVAEREVVRTGLRKVYVATMEAGDGETAERIACHRVRRDDGWTTIEEPLALPEILAAQTAADRAVLVDCLTLWLANLMAAERDIPAERERLAGVLAGAALPVVLVSNEVGGGIVPDNPLARRFRDEAGLLHQRIAEVAGRVILVTAGLARTLKDNT